MAMDTTYDLHISLLEKSLDLLMELYYILSLSEGLKWEKIMKTRLIEEL